MTALTAPALPAEDDVSFRPLPWRRKAGVTWRPHPNSLTLVAPILGP